MTRSTLIFGALRRCGDHFHLEYECPDCGAPRGLDENRTLGKLKCCFTNREFIVVAAPKIRQNGIDTSDSVCTTPSTNRDFLDKLLNGRHPWAMHIRILNVSATQSHSCQNSGSDWLLLISKQC
jgi:hypothetical protein